MLAAVLGLSTLIVSIGALIIVVLNSVHGARGSDLVDLRGRVQLMQADLTQAYANHRECEQARTDLLRENMELLREIVHSRTTPLRDS